MGNELKEPDMKQGDGLGWCSSPGDMMVNKLESVDINSFEHPLYGQVLIDLSTGDRAITKALKFLLS